MKRLLAAGNLLLVFAITFILTGCFKDHITRTYTLMRPVYGLKATVLQEIKSDEPQTLEAPGKIFIQGRYIFLNEVGKGVHIIDNVDPSHPKMAAFIKIPGNVDIAVKGTTLYADMYRDMVVIDITDPLNSKFIRSEPNVFPNRWNGWNGMPDSTYIVTEWVIKDTMINVEDEGAIWWGLDAVAFASQSGSTKANHVPGIAGSMSRFSIVNDFLYTVNETSLISFDIKDPQNPKAKGNATLGQNIETVYPFGGNLFVGSTTGLFIFELSDPANPKQAGTFSHAMACDPVISDGQHAFVTLRAGTPCNGSINQMDVLDVSNINNPVLLKSYALTNPAGLAKDGNALFVCDGPGGLIVYDATDVEDLKVVKQIRDVEPFDVIAWDKRLLMVAKNGIYQYDYSNLADMKELSVIQVIRK